MRAVRKITRPTLSRHVLVALCALAVAAAGCGSDDENNDGAKLPKDTGGGLFIPDTSEADAGEEDAGADTAEEIDLGEPDIVAVDTGPICVGFGCVCQENSDCESGHCIDSPGGQICTKTCSETCPDGYKCVTAGSVDGVSICVPQYGNICAPCKENSLCQTTGNKGSKCVDRGAIGAFCGTPCQSADDCPSNYKCDKEATDVTGEQVSQCVLLVGACACSKVALEQGWATTCSKTIGDAVCQGERVCLSDGKEGAPPGGGLTGCIAKEPEAELCDGKDNDCDAETDEATCEDDEACTLNDCGGDAGCLNTNKAGSCSDESECTVDDTCADGKCVPGKAKACDDDNPCTKDTCVADKGCVYTPAENEPCNADDNPCTVSDSCIIDKDSGKSTCTAGDQKACDSGGPCSKGSCLASTGACQYTAQDGFPCDDGDPCSVQTVCDGEVCKGVPNACDDKLGCTSDSCDAKIGCVHAPVGAGQACDDGDPCTVDSTCDAGGVCACAKPNTCDDSNNCTKDTCDGKTGCGHEPLNATPCDDGNSCTGPDACASGSCKAGGDLCVCKTTEECAKLEDGDLCNGTLICKEEGGGSKCVVDPVTVVKCDDGDGCTKNTCDKQTGKCATENLQISCDDSDICTEGDKCGLHPQSGKHSCVPGLAKSCDDSVACTVDTCDPTKGCQNISAEGKDVACYSGPAKTAGVGKCKAGLQTCKPDGTLTLCVGEVKPEAKEICGNKVNDQLVDDNCDGKVDEGCGPALVFGHMATGAVAGKAGNLSLRGSVGASLTAGVAATQGAQTQVESGFYRWLKGLLSK